MSTDWNGRLGWDDNGSDQTVYTQEVSVRDYLQGSWANGTNGKGIRSVNRMCTNSCLLNCTSTASPLEVSQAHLPCSFGILRL